MKIFLTILFTFFLNTLLFAQSTINGTVQLNDGTPAVAVNVYLEGTTIGATTNASGFYEIKNIEAGDYTLKIAGIIIKPVSKKISVEANKTQTLDFIVEESSDNLNEVSVRASSVESKSNVSTSLRLQTEIEKLPQNIQLIQKEDLNNQIVLSMSDGLLRNVSGTMRLEHWGDAYARVNMRGSRASAFFNGVNITSSWGPLTEDMSYVERVEFVKGPAGFMMSSGEPSGIYNIVTKKPTGEDFNGSVRFTTGSYDLYRAEADIDTKITDKLSARLNVMGQNKNSFRDYEYNDRYIVAPSLRYDFDSKTKLTAEYIYQKAKMSNIGAAYIFSTEGYATYPAETTLGDPGLEPSLVDDRTFNVNFQHEFRKDWKVTAQTTYVNSYQVGQSMWAGAVQEDLIQRNVSLFESSNIMKFAQVYVNGKVMTGSVSHKLIGALDVGTKEYMADWNQSHLLETGENYFSMTADNYQAPTNGYPDFDLSRPLEIRSSPYGRINLRYSGIYIQDELGFLDDKIRLTLATRFTDISQSAYGGAERKASKWTPRIGLSGSVDEHTSIYTLYDQSFVPQAGILRNGEDIKPITGNNLEIGVKRDWFDKKWTTTLSVYQILKKNELISDPNNAPTEQYSIVKGESEAKGVEFDLRGEIVKGLNLTLNYAFTENKITESNIESLVEGDLVPGYAKHTANTWIAYKHQTGFLKGAGISLGATVLADRTTWGWASVPNQKSLGDYTKVDAGVSWGNEKLQVTLNIYNLLDEYLYSGAPYGAFYYYQAEAPRNWRLALAYKF
ncbi:TonB-dependent siderophore receptor [Bernardetia litoralis DSM 6794]|uniref:TonB-dependent siderophore receptor n=1 Tax=Bernardetia litoralis (strain ATCC 23117 / DSM 6794 / NBRC 15988 / NCIMB 1366 / Fx l1 / Sio-4) TaxID=880071 RepID=I4AIS0_BERLS|nr:TonB-dependent receptor [Bernardetia litoralis]AFM03855.1 TonB-dependent siderophore receptor [Bernardetia litoralis DSM 6794]